MDVRLQSIAVSPAPRTTSRLPLTLMKSAGSFSIDHEIRQAHEKNYNYFYLSEGYDNSSAWKSKMPGFEWWTGSEWSKDPDRFAFLCDAEDGAKELKDIMDVYENPCTREKFWNKKNINR